MKNPMLSKLKKNPMAKMKSKTKEAKAKTKPAREKPTKKKAEAADEGWEFPADGYETIGAALGLVSGGKKEAGLKEVFEAFDLEEFRANPMQWGENVVAALEIKPEKAAKLAMLVGEIVADAPEAAPMPERDAASLASSIGTILGLVAGGKKEASLREAIEALDAVFDADETAKEIAEALELKPGKDAKLAAELQKMLVAEATAAAAAEAATVEEPEAVDSTLLVFWTLGQEADLDFFLLPNGELTKEQKTVLKSSANYIEGFDYGVSAPAAENAPPAASEVPNGTPPPAGTQSATEAVVAPVTEEASAAPAATADEPDDMESEIVEMKLYAPVDEAKKAARLVALAIVGPNTHLDPEDEVAGWSRIWHKYRVDPRTGYLSRQKISRVVKTGRVV